MPKEHKKRGRREEKKRKRAEDVESSPSKKPKSDNIDEDDIHFILNAEDQHQEDEQYGRAGHTDTPFYGLLDEEEQEYFKRADSILEVNQFEDPQERDLFLANVYREAQGKELKLANSQSCSRLIERLILMSSPSQLKTLFQKFSGHFLHLVQHRFASHCCEALFLQCAPIVTQELTEVPADQQQEPENGEVLVSMENLFLYALNELGDNLGYLMTDRFASHTLRVLLAVFSGQPLKSDSTLSLLRSKKKENINVGGQDGEHSGDSFGPRIVPQSFGAAMDKTISSCAAGLDTTSLRALATQPLSNPVLQLFLEFEFLKARKQNEKQQDSLFLRLLPDNPPSQGTESASFINGLLYDSVGSRLLEVIICSAPGKTFKVIYKELLRDRLASLAKNDIASYVASKALERLGKEDLKCAMQQIRAELPYLIEHSRISIIKTLIERCHVRQVETDPLASTLKEIYSADGSNVVLSMLNCNTDDMNNISKDRQRQVEAQNNIKKHASLLARAMLNVPGPLRDLITSSLLELDTPLLMRLAKDRWASYLIQNSLTFSPDTKIFRRKIGQRFQGHILELTFDSVGSHVVDSLWTGTDDLLFLRERFAEELVRDEAEVRESLPGTAVWRNWKMDLYKRRRVDWISDANGPKGNGENSDRTVITANSSAKSSLDLARARFAASKVDKPWGSRRSHNPTPSRPFPTVGTRA